MISKSTFGLWLFAATGLIVTAILAGDNTGPGTSGMLAYFINGNNVVIARHALDLSKPIFLDRETPVCMTEDGLDHYSPSNPGNCTVIDGNIPAGLIGIQTDGMRAPSFQMQMVTTSGPVRGWVNYNSLHN